MTMTVSPESSPLAEVRRIHGRDADDAVPPNNGDARRFAGPGDADEDSEFAAERRRAAVAAVALSAGFAVVHAAWASGWRWGVPEKAAPIGDRPAFLAYVLVATLAFAVVSILAIRVAATAVSDPSVGSGREDAVAKWCRRLALIGGIATLVRGLGGLVEDAAATVLNHPPTTVSVICDVWFLAIGACLGGAAMRRRHQRFSSTTWSKPL